MDRKEPFIEGEIYHVYTRGVEKRDVFLCEADYERFVALLLLSNSSERVHLGNLCSKHRGRSLIEMLGRVPPVHAHTDVLAYALMPNHAHLIVREKKPGGISAFMHKLMTSYSMYFNKKNKRSGPLFTRPFRSRRVDDDAYFRWLFAYVHLNPLGLAHSDWKKGKVDKKAAGAFMREYLFSSFHDFFFGERPQSAILNKSALPIDPREFRAVDDLLSIFSNSPEYQEKFLL